MVALFVVGLILLATPNAKAGLRNGLNSRMTDEH
jgi:hypothetical protein